MAEIITPKTGLLIALQHPLDKTLFHAEDPNRGPPFLLSPEMFSSHLRLLISDTILSYKETSNVYTLNSLIRVMM